MRGECRTQRWPWHADIKAGHRSCGRTAAALQGLAGAGHRRELCLSCPSASDRSLLPFTQEYQWEQHCYPEERLGTGRGNSGQRTLIDWEYARITDALTEVVQDRCQCPTPHRAAHTLPHPHYTIDIRPPSPRTHGCTCRLLSSPCTPPCTLAPPAPARGGRCEDLDVHARRPHPDHAQPPAGGAHLVAARGCGRIWRPPTDVHGGRTRECLPHFFGELPLRRPAIHFSALDSPLRNVE
ncbi:hypothetical protein PLICRDRAFT_646585 [Plicaturopsis crispa FD-325 SS-3]|nr:hypothetical protein PLICRDRAFT_646585 [Plicaturopsis crispa FD-325 SS-3]